MADSLIGGLDVGVHSTESTRSNIECIVCAPGAFDDGRQRYGDGRYSGCDEKSQQVV